MISYPVGSYGEVYHADWNGTVSIFMNQLAIIFFFYYYYFLFLISDCFCNSR